MTRICWRRGHDTHRGSRRTWKKWRIVTAWLVALTIAAIILLALRDQMASADQLYSTEPGAYQRYDDGGVV